MFNSSRRKIILAIMGFLILLFAVTLGVILTASFHEVRQKNADMLGRFVEMYSLDPDREEKPVAGPVPERRDPPLDQKPDYQLSTFYTVAIAENGSVLSVDNAGRDIYSSEELVQIAESILSGGKRSGRAGNLSYAVSERDGYTLVALMDNTVSEGGLRTLLRNVLTVGGAAIAVLFLFSLQLAKRIIRPLEENDRQQKQFISDASHELKTPVAVIETNAEMLSREIGENEWLANIRYENERMGGLVKQLLDLSRAESAETPMEPVDFSRLVTGETLAFESLAFDQGKMLQTDIAGGIVLNGNRTQLAQLVSILLDNAVRHSTGTEIRLSLKRRSRTAVLTVANEGEAIPKEKLDHLFDRFYQADEARNQDGQHYGLGLSIARAVAEKHGGHIEASCQNGEIRFTAVLPA
jgi:signal transduction histidine kinase